MVEQEAALWIPAPRATRFQAPARLPMAFQVQTVCGLTPSIRLICALTRPWGLSIQTQSSSARPSALGHARD